MRKLSWILAGALLLAQGLAFGQDSLLDTVRTVGADNAPAPVEHTFSIATAGNYELTLTDLGAPAAELAEVSFAVTRGTSVIGTPRDTPGMLAFNAATGGDYVVRITGRPGSTAGSGLFRVQLRAAGSTTVIDEFIDVLALPPGVPSSGQFVFDARFSAQVAGNYDIVLRDLQWPQQMATLLVAVVEEGGPLLTALDAVTTNPAQATVALAAGREYHVFVIGEPPSATSGGLYSLRISGTGGVPFERTIGVAGVALLGEATLTAGGSELVTGDLLFPVALEALGAHVVRGGQSVVSSLTSETKVFTAGAGVHQVFGYARPAPAGGAGQTGGAGTVRAQLRPTGQPDVFSGVLPVTLPDSGVFPYTFDVAVLAGGYRLRLADYQFPAAFTSVGIAVTQGGAVLGTPLASPGTLDVTTTAGRVQLLAFARPVAAGGLFGVDLTPSGGGAPAIETTQGVGRLFTAYKVTVTGNARYDVTLTDVGFPANFGDLAAAVTRGAQREGFIYGPGTFDFTATPGNYFVNVIARAAANETSGTYGLAVTAKPPAPVITFTATPSKAVSGNSVDLTWSATNATACTASSGWTGAKAASGTERTAALTTNTTYSLSCTGSGGISDASLTVEVLPASGGGQGGGGGGALDLRLLLLLAALLALRPRAPRRAC
jgi:hypothetical protein